jgi:hypothetical protein
MTIEHDPTNPASAPEPVDARPLAVRIERDRSGSASFDWSQVLDALTRGLEQRVRSALGEDVVVVGVRFLDADGRAVRGPAPSGITVVGFTNTMTKEMET